MKDETTTQQWCDIRQAASHSGLSVAFLRKAVRERRVPFARVGGKLLRFRCCDLDLWLQNGATSENMNDGKR